MRRKDREIKDRRVIDGIIDQCRVCRLALCENGQPYVIPLNFGYDGEYLFFHSANEGKKIDIIKQNNRVGFEFDIFHSVITALKPCDWGVRYESVVGTGTATFIDSENEKIDALNCILDHYGGAFNASDIPLVDAVTIIQVAISSISGKQKR